MLTLCQQTTKWVRKPNPLIKPPSLSWGRSQVSPISPWWARTPVTYILISILASLAKTNLWALLSKMEFVCFFLGLGHCSLWTKSAANKMKILGIIIYPLFKKKKNLSIMRFMRCSCFRPILGKNKSHRWIKRKLWLCVTTPTHCLQNRLL